MPIDTIDVDALEEDLIQPNRPSIAPSSDLEPAELLQPSLNIQAQFEHYNKKYFWNRIVNATVEYSNRMTLCAGTCTFRPPNVRIALSEPILKFRPRSDLLSTLLHEMIHAFLFLTEGLSRDGPDGHGPIFMSHAHRINAAEEAIHISPYHEFHAEVDHYRVHHWRCQKCHNLVKRAMNRPPGPADHFWTYHVQNCGGQYVKVAGPPKKEKPPKPPKNRAVAVASKGSDHVPNGVMKTFRIDDMLSGRKSKKQVVQMANCPVCAASVKQDDMNDHLDLCLAEGMFTQSSNAPTAQPKPPAPQQQTSVPTIRATYPTKPATTHKPVSLCEDTICPAPVTSTRGPNHETPNRSVSTSHLTTSQESYEMMEYVADPVMLQNLALTPKKFQPEDVDKIFKDLPLYVPETSDPVPENGIKNFLHSLIHPESPSCKQQQAKAIINPLTLSPSGEEFSFRAVSERWSMSSLDILELIQRKSTTDELGNIVFSSQLIEMLSSPHPPNANRKVCSNKAPKRPRSNTGTTEKRENQVHPSLKRGSEAIRPGSRDGIQREADGKRHERSVFKRRVRENLCPLCSQDIGKEKLEEHISICVAGSQGQEGDDTEEVPSRGQEKLQTPAVVPGRAGSRLGDARRQENQRCPICDVALSRQDLESHVARCMMSTGLADAF